MAAVFPQEVPDERFRAVPVASVAHERVLELACDPSDIEHPVPALHAFQVNRRDVQVVAEQEVGRRRVAVQPDLLVLPHPRAVPPAVAQPGQLAGVVRSDPVRLREPARDRVEVPAVGIEIDVGPVGRPVVLGGEVISQCLQPPVQVRVVPVLRRTRDGMAEFLAGVILDGQDAVDVPAEPQRPDHVMRRSDEVIAAQRLEPFVLLAGHPGCLVQVRAEPGTVELADDPDVARLLLVRVDHVAAG